MPVRIFNNIPSLNAQRILGNNNDRLAKSVERISSGLRINRGSDDAAGLAISEGLRSDVRTLRQANRNANDGISLLNVAEGALNEQAGILIRIKELASQSATGTVGSTERQTIQLEVDALLSEINRISATTEFNGKALLNGELSNDSFSYNFSTGAQVTRSAAQISNENVSIQIGLNNQSASRIDFGSSVNLKAVSVETLGLNSGDTVVRSTSGSGTVTVTAGTNTGRSDALTEVSQALVVTGAAEALDALGRVDSALDVITSARGRVGAAQNRLSRTIANLGIATENLQAAESAIRDADIAEEVALLTRNQILVQASTAMVGQANLIPQTVLQLLG